MTWVPRESPRNGCNRGGGNPQDHRGEGKVDCAAKDPRDPFGESQRSLFSEKEKRGKVSTQKRENNAMNWKKKGVRPVQKWRRSENMVTKPGGGPPLRQGGDDYIWGGRLEYTPCWMAGKQRSIRVKAGNGAPGGGEGGPLEQQKRKKRTLS